ncbi:RHS repeat-associated core domain-containing protein [Streptomyces sp. NPDC047315]|uniref:RHS repeat domain-containing protein n=1 Tax=Streptomyces sp. NPDC047315 TaxID=3155142 RepID=UPI0033C69416
MDNQPRALGPSTVDTSVPAAHAAQFDQADAGQAANYVNLFRGTVNHPLDLVTLPGRNGLDVTLRAVYDSNVLERARRWNVDHPTGTTGLGWTLPVDAIVADDRGSAIRSSHRFFLVSAGRATRLEPIAGPDQAGRRHYATRLHTFWTITYDETHETWEIVHEDGTTYRYGDGDPRSGGVRWAVGWGSWTGPSAVSSGQRRYAVGWNLVEVRNLTGDRISYAYANVEQEVGGRSGALAYTKASYLSTVTDVFGRTVTLHYEDKEVDEYGDPHRALSQARDALVPNAFQSRYETRYLDRIDARDGDGAAMFTVELAYEVQQMPPAAATTGRRFAKRFLTAVTTRTPDGNAPPGHVFAYHDATSDAAPLPGALRSVTYPEGGRADYAYAEQDLPSNAGDPDLPLRKTVPGRAKGTPRVWFGPDYTVVTWHDRKSGTVSVSAYRWLGSWAEYTSPPLKAGEITGDGPRVEAQAEYFCVTWTEAHRQTTRAYRPDPRRFGQWTDQDVSTELTAAVVESHVTAGDDFLVFANPAHRGNPFWGWQWRWQTRTWEKLPQLPDLPLGHDPRVVLTGGPTFYVAGSYVPPTGASGPGTLHLALAHRDPAGTTGEWAEPSTTAPQLTVIEPAKPDTPLPLTLTAAATAVVVTHLTGWNQSALTADYALSPLTWDARFWFGPKAKTFSYTTPLDKSGQPVLPVFDTVVTTTLIGNCGNVIRYQGGDPGQADAHWLEHRRTAKASADLRFAYGEDCAVVQDAKTRRNTLIAFDPAAATAGSFTEQPLPDSAGPPSLQGRYLCLGGDLRTDTAGRRWTDAAGHLPGTAHDTVRNAAPQYVLTQDGPDLRVAFLADGTVVGDETLSGERTTAGANPAPGRLLAGAQGFATYPAGDPSLDEASAIHLHQVLADTATKPVRTTLVVSVAVHGHTGDPASARTTHFQYDLAAASYDPVQRLVQHRQVTTTAGKGCGKSVSWFSNGVASDVPEQYPPGAPVNYTEVLNGQLLRLRTYSDDDALVSSRTYVYDVQEKATQQDGGEYAYVPGSWVRLSEVSDLRDGVTRSTEHHYASHSGLLVRSVSQDHDAAGTEQTLTTETTYAHEVPAYAEWTRTAHALSQPARVTKTSKTSAVAVTSVDLTLWHEYPTAGGPQAWAPGATYCWLGTGDPAHFPDAEPDPTQWLTASRTTARTPAGLLPAEVLDADGRPTSVVYDRSACYPVATFHGASAAAGEACFYGFEAYEVNPGWGTPNGGAGGLVLTDDDPCAGRRCLTLPAGTAPTDAPQLTRRPTDQSRTYLIAGSVRSADGGTGVRITLTAPDGGVRAQWDGPLPNTAGAWRPFSVPVDLSRGGPAQDSVVDVQLVNTGGQTAHLDLLRFAPKDCAFTASVYDPTGAVLATVRESGAVQRRLLDRFRQVRAVSSAAGGVRDATVLHVPQKAGAEGEGTYNASVKTTPAQQGGFWGEFVATDLTRHWDVPDATAWTVDLPTRTLHHQGAGTDTMRLRAGAFTPAAARVEVLPAGRLADPVTLLLGPVGVRYDPAAQAMELIDATENTIESTPLKGLGAADWMLLGSGNTVLFFVDGRQLFQRDMGRSVSGAVGLSARGPVAFRGFLAFAEPELTVTFADGTGRAVQHHSFARPGWTVTATHYDALGRPVVQTKPVPREAAPGAFGYWPELVGAIDLDGTGTIGGRVAQYYGPQGGGPTDDAGYPFLRTVYGADPGRRVVERGLPGRELSVDPRVPRERRRTTRHDYGAAGKCFQRTTTDPGGHSCTEVFNGRGQLLSRRIGSTANATSTTTFHYTPAGRLARVVLPNADAVCDEGDPQHWKLTFEHDFLGRVVAHTTPDLGDPGQTAGPGAVRTHYGPSGRVRLRQNPEQAGAGTFVYVLYDGLGRITEQGLADLKADTWEQAGARAAADPRWPASAGAAQWCRRFSYDGDGSDPALLAKLTDARAKAAADDAARVHETFRYDEEGRLAQQSLTVPGYDAATRTVQYGYDGPGRVSSIRQQAPGARHDAYYKRNALGQVTAIGSTAGAGDFGGYAYHPDGSVSERTVPTGAGLRQAYAYDSAGRLTGLTDGTVFDQTLQHAPDGAPTQTQEYEHWSGRHTTRTLSYDDVRRLAAVAEQVNDGQSGDAAGEPTTFRYDYDANGNIRRVLKGSAASDYAYETGSNRLATVDGTSPEVFQYDRNGNVTAPAPGARLSYDTVTGLPDGALHQGTRLTWTTSAGGARVLRESTESGTTDRRLYWYAADGALLASSETRPTFYVHGPTGPGCICPPDGGPRFLIADHLRSTRAVLAPDGTVAAAFRYGTWGETTVVRTAGDVPVFLYTGQEYEPQLALYAFPERLYAPGVGRFLGPDPNGQFASPYLYAANSPQLFVDPTGGFAWLVVALAAAIGAAVGLIEGAISSAEASMPTGAAIGRTLLLGLLGAVSGALMGGAGELVATATSAAVFESGLAGTLAGGALRIGAGVGGGAAFGAGSGAVGALIDAQDPASAAAQGAYVGAVSGLIYGAVGEFTTGASRALGLGPEQTTRDVEVEVAGGITQRRIDPVLSRRQALVTVGTSTVAGVAVPFVQQELTADAPGLWRRMLLGGLGGALMGIVPNEVGLRGQRLRDTRLELTTRSPVVEQEPQVRGVAWTPL